MYEKEKSAVFTVHKAEAARQQGLIDHLIVGREVESEWPLLVEGITLR
ncbi:MAG: hypothetical protein H7A51_15670 [Akkermansiaceae bacterium]|nr:hypothetical protein [Akkermansiaceae bacterium]